MPEEFDGRLIPMDDLVTADLHMECAFDEIVYQRSGFHREASGTDDSNNEIIRVSYVLNVAIFFIYA